MPIEILNAYTKDGRLDNKVVAPRSWGCKLKSTQGINILFDKYPVQSLLAIRIVSSLINDPI